MKKEKLDKSLERWVNKELSSFIEKYSLRFIVEQASIIYEGMEHRRTRSRNTIILPKNTSAKDAVVYLIQKRWMHYWPEKSGEDLTSVLNKTAEAIKKRTEDEIKPKIGLFLENTAKECFHDYMSAIKSNLFVELGTLLTLRKMENLPYGVKIDQYIPVLMQRLAKLGESYANAPEEEKKCSKEGFSHNLKDGFQQYSKHSEMPLKIRLLQFIKDSDKLLAERYLYTAFSSHSLDGIEPKQIQKMSNLRFVKFYNSDDLKIDVSPL